MDIVERLQNQTPYGLDDHTVLIDAAAEIQGLRNLCERKDEEINALLSAQAGWGRVERLSSEVERLLVHVQDLEAVSAADAVTITGLNADIERLRTVGDALVAAIRNHDLTNRHLADWENIRHG